MKQLPINNKFFIGICHIKHFIFYATWHNNIYFLSFAFVLWRFFRSFCIFKRNKKKTSAWWKSINCWMQFNWEKATKEWEQDRKKQKKKRSERELKDGVISFTKEFYVYTVYTFYILYFIFTRNNRNAERCFTPWTQLTSNA